MTEISAETFAKSCIHTIKQLRKGKKLALWIRVKDIGEKLVVENIYDLIDKEIKGKFETYSLTDEQIRKYKRHGSKLIENEQFMYAHECIMIPVIMHCRVLIPKSIEFKSKLGFNQFDITLTKEQSVLKSVINAFEGENTQTQYSVLPYTNDLHFHDYRLAIEVDEKGHNDRDIDYEIRRQKISEKELGCKFIRINPTKKGFNIFIEIGRIQNYIAMSIKNSTKKTLIDELSEKLLGLELKSNNSIKTKCLKYVAQKVLPTL